VTFKALPVTSFFHSLIWHAGTVAEEGGMATKAVLLYHLLSGLPDIDRLRLLAKGKDCGMAQSVAGLEVVFPYEAVMRHMACIAVSDAPVGTVRPCGKLGSHYVAVDAYPRVIGDVGGCIGYLQKEEKQSCKGSEDNNHGCSPVCRRGEEADQFPGSAHRNSLQPVRMELFPFPPVRGVPGGYRKLIKHIATSAVPYRLSIVRDSLMTVGSPR